MLLWRVEFPPYDRRFVKAFLVSRERLFISIGMGVCGDVGHMTVACRNALTYFKCVQLGRISSFCCSITSLPSSSSPSNLFFSSPHISPSSSTIPLSHYSFHSTVFPQ
jgi:hypothetical protein